MEEKIKAAIGVYIGLTNEQEKLLLRRRVETSSIIPGKSFKGCWELPGGGVQVKENMPYYHLVNELIREVKEEVGIELILDAISLIPPMYSFFFGEKRDLALVIPIRAWFAEPTKGETRWVSIEELNELAREYKPANKEKEEDGQGIVSGWGKRMHCMALQSFYIHGDYDARMKAQETLKEIQKNW